MRTDLMPTAKEAWEIARNGKGFCERTDAARQMIAEGQARNYLEGYSDMDAVTLLMDAAYVAGIVYGVRRERRKNRGKI